MQLLKTRTHPRCHSATGGFQYEDEPAVLVQTFKTGDLDVYLCSLLPELRPHKGTLVLKYAERRRVHKEHLELVPLYVLPL